MTPEDVRLALARAGWLMSLAQFCELLGWPTNDYSKEKYLRFQQMATSASQFDETVWGKIIGWGDAQRAPRAKGAPEHGAE